MQKLSDLFSFVFAGIIGGGLVGYLAWMFIFYAGFSVLYQIGPLAYIVGGAIIGVIGALMTLFEQEEKPSKK